MILKQHFTPASMWPFVRFELGLGAVASVAAWLLFDRAGLGWAALPASLAVVLGTALSILLAVRVNTAYQRWWEGSAEWAQISGLSRNLGRVVVAVSGSKVAGGARPEAVHAFQASMVGGQVAYVNALRMQLRGESNWPELAPFLSPEEYQRVLSADNKAALLLQMHSQRIFAAYGSGILTGLDNFQMEVALAALSQQQALAERVTVQPVPRVYDVYSRYFTHLYVCIFPFAVIGTLPAYRWLVIPATLILAYAFRIVERIGAVVENPFAGTVQDVPLTAICRTIERDLLELMGALERPPALEPVAGYLW